MRRRAQASAALRALALGSVALGALASPAPAWAEKAEVPLITVSEPAGFEDLTREQMLLVDIYFGGGRRGEVEVQVAPGKLTFLDPQALLRLLPEVAESDTLARILTGQPLPTNADLACTQGTNRNECGRLSPENIGVIFDRDHFRVDVFLNPRFLTVQDNVTAQYLPAPEGGISTVNSIGALFSGQSGSGADYYNLHDRLIVGDGERRLRAELTLANKQGFGADSVAFEWDRPERRYSAGEFWARGNDVSGRRKLIGAGVQTQIDTRRDKDQIFGSPIVVYLARRARVDVVRDGRVLSSAIYDAGNQEIDTADLPDGSYEIVLRIAEAGQPAHEERRFFTKSQRLPSLGRTDFFAFGGLLVKGNDPGALTPSNHPYAEGGAVRRLSQHWAVEGTVQATDHTVSGEVGATLITPFALVRAAVLADSAGTLGGLAQIASTGDSRVNFSFDLRRIESGRATLNAPGTPLGGPVFGSPYLDRSLTSYSQVGGYLSYSLAKIRLVGTATYRRERGEPTRYSVGPSIEWDMLRKGPFKLTAHGDFAATERGNAGFAGISLEVFKAHASLTARAGGRSSTIADDEQGDGAVGSIAGTWENAVAGGELALGAGYDHQPRQDDVILSSEFRHPLATFAGEFVHSDKAPASVSQYSLGFQTTLTAGGGAVSVAGKTTTESMIVARVDGARPGDRFEVLVNDQVSGTINGTEAVTVPLPAYRGYQVRIRPVGESLLSYDNSVRSVGLYPGAVTSLRWTASPVSIKFGRLIGPDGKPIAGASITGRGVWSETDEQGYFQVEVPDDAPLTVTTRDGRTFSITLPAADKSGDIARLGSIACCGSPQIQLGALDIGAPAHERASQ